MYGLEPMTVHKAYYSSEDAIHAEFGTGGEARSPKEPS